MVEYRIKYKLGLLMRCRDITPPLMHHIHRRQTPHYLSDIVQLAVTATTRPGLRSASSEVYTTECPGRRPFLESERSVTPVQLYGNSSFHPGINKH